MNYPDKILDIDNPSLIKVHEKLILNNKSQKDKIKSIYNFVRDDIKFGYNEADNIKASKVLTDGYGQCNTKATLLMALLKLSNIEFRIHGFLIDKRLQYGAITGLFYLLAPKYIIHSWVEVKVEGEWLNLEGFILDSLYLNSLLTYFPNNQDSLCGYGVATNKFQTPEIQWDGHNSTYIQQKGIVKDLGLFSGPDEFYEKYGVNLRGGIRLLYKYFIRHIMNRNISKIRSKHKTGQLKTLCSVDEIKSIF